MQMAVPEAISFKEESEETKSMYGLDKENTKIFRAGLPCRPAPFRTGRALSCRSITAAAGNAWDAHKDLKKNHGGLAAQTDKPVAGLLRDLKQRGLLDETIVVWATEFGRTPGAEARTAATTIRSASPCGWPAEGSRAESFTGRRTRSASMPWRTAITSRISTPPSYINWVSIRGGSTSLDASASKWTTASRFRRSFLSFLAAAIWTIDAIFSWRRHQILRSGLTGLRSHTCIAARSTRKG